MSNSNRLRRIQRIEAVQSPSQENLEFGMDTETRYGSQPLIRCGKPFQYSSIAP
jgi:hypothetical protein